MRYICILVCIVSLSHAMSDWHPAQASNHEVQRAAHITQCIVNWYVHNLPAMYAHATDMQKSAIDAYIQFARVAQQQLRGIMYYPGDVRAQYDAVMQIGYNAHYNLIAAYIAAETTPPRDTPIRTSDPHEYTMRMCACALSRLRRTHEPLRYQQYLCLSNLMHRPSHSNESVLQAYQDRAIAHQDRFRNNYPIEELIPVSALKRLRYG